MSSPALSLDEQIAAAERRVIARDEAVREQLHRLGAALKSETVTGVRRGAIGLVATLGVLGVIGLARRTSHHGRSRRTHASRVSRSGDESGKTHAAAALPAGIVVAEAAVRALSSRSGARPALPWPALVAALWPLMPSALTRRVPARAAGLLAGLATAVVLPWWSRRHPRREPRDGH